MGNQKLYTQGWLYQQKKNNTSFPIKGIVLLSLVTFAYFFSDAQKLCDQIRLNQVGYYPNSSKLAFITCAVKNSDFYIVTMDGQDTVYQGTLGDKRKSAFSSTVTRIADFSLFTVTGNYVLRIDNKQSFPFEIRSDVYTALGKAVLKSFYYQRSSIALDEKFAGKWSRDAKHLGDIMVVRPSTYADGRGQVVPSSGGWYDKGDFNKCIVSSGITMSTLLSGYEDFTNYFDTLSTNIPESHDKVPDVLNEVIYNLRWMFKMQDPFDGGVYHKCLAAKVEDVDPHMMAKNTETVQKSTAASLDFAAVMAQAGRIFRRMQSQLPGLGDSCLRASTEAWFWALKNPNVEFDGSGDNRGFKTVSNNAYERDLTDEWLWAASEMFITSKNKMYFDVVEQNIDDSVELPSPNHVAMLAYYSMLRYEGNLPVYAKDLVKVMQDRMLRLADEYLSHIASNAFSTVMGQSKNDFSVGSNAVAANQGILLINAYLNTGNDKYVAASMTNLDYLLGRNATGYCFVTGCFGNKSPLHPYYRISGEVDGEPVPGMLVAGPSAGRDKPLSFLNSSDIETSYQDSESSSETNQVSIDWNSAMVYLVNAVQAMQYELGFSAKTASPVAVNR